ncbi:MAG: TonB-dependent receptor [Halioglobus sp.]|nr:TonB-dependent receptor [Halioglobus sp.]
MHRHRKALLWLVACSPSLAVAAGTTLEDVVVTGAFSRQPALTSSVSVLDEARIEALNKRNLADLLKTVPGLLVEEQGGPGGLTAVSVRGGEANFTLVLLDGVPINDPTNTRGGGFDFADLNPALVQRIEVVRGPQSAVYGSDAVAGVINIITRRPLAGHTQSLYAEAGSDDFENLQLGLIGRTDAFDYALELSARDDGEPTPGSERESENLRLRVGWQPLAGHRFSASYRYLQGERSSFPEQSGGPVFARTDDLDRADYENRVTAFNWAFDVTDGWHSDLSVSRFRRDESVESPGIPPFIEVPPNGSDTDFRRDRARWVNSLRGAAWSVDIGADYRREEGDSTGFVEFFGARTPTDFSLKRATTGVFAQLSARPVPAILLQGSARHDEPEDFDSETSWRLGASYSLPLGFELSANWGEAYKLPSFFALGNALVGNPDLAPEQAEAWDAGIAFNAAGRLRLQATWFRNDFEDLVDFDDETFRNVNRQNVRTSGVELRVSWQSTPAWQLVATGTYTEIDVRGADTVLTGRPEWVGGLLSQWRIGRGWQSALDYRYTGTQWAVSRHTGEALARKLGDYHRLDWVLRWTASPHWQLQLSVDNLSDEHYETAVGFAAPDRALRIGVGFTH